GNLPTTPWAINQAGRGPAWANSLFEDNAEFGLGMRLALDQQRLRAVQLLVDLAPAVGDALVTALLQADQTSDRGIADQRGRVGLLREALAPLEGPEAKELMALASTLVRHSVWIVGGDGWAYDIGFGGLDHVLASGRNVNILVLDTEVYSNTGGQMSKSTPRSAVAKFAAGGKPLAKKDLGLIAMTYEGVYVAQIAMGHNDTHTVRALLEAEAYDGPSLIIAYSHCIAHGINMTKGMGNQKAAVESGHWPLYRYNPAHTGNGRNPFVLDSKTPKIRFEDYAYREARYKMLTKIDPVGAKQLMALAEEDVRKRWKHYEGMAVDGGHERRQEEPSPGKQPVPEQNKGV
ncbi:MAG: thiamine pyrophosphate-dependent enzyme, partial [Ignavibacteria bacterium]|nr:thiamine pyrophosphate-dependent enzyme [Ignavibacteria bacterium]